MTISRSLPHPREDLHRFVNQLNVRYNIGIPIPDPGLTHAERNTTEDLAARIYRRLETHFFTGGLGTLNAIVREFDLEAKAFWSQRVKKPQGDPDTLLRTANPPLAANLVERDWLQTVFSRVLDKFQPMQAPRTFGRAKSGPAALGASAGETSGLTGSSSSTSKSKQPKQPKRHADVEEGINKRVKADVPKADPIRDLTASAQCRRQLDASAHGLADAPRVASASALKPLERQRRPLAKSTASASTLSSTTASTSIPSAIFSTPGDDPIPTQDTIEASTQEQYRPAASQSSYVDAPSSTMVDAILTSFQEYDEDLTVQPERVQMPSLNRRVQGEDASILASTTANGLKKGDNSAPTMHDRLRCVWPCFPPWLREAPFAVVWEICRIAQSCGVDLDGVEDLRYNPEWTKQKALRGALWKHQAFQGKQFPEPSSDAAWTASLEPCDLTLAGQEQVVYTASLEFSKSTPNLLALRMHPLRMEQSYRLARRYGADRFFELLLPSPDGSNLPAFIKDEGSFFAALVLWLGEAHFFCGRNWKAFYTKSGGSRKLQKDLHFGPDPKPVYKDRVYFFAEGGMNLTSLPLHTMLKWALHLRAQSNRDQPALKLFQRIALVLSRTSPTVVFEPHQIENHSDDILSPTGKVMNDGIARMSPAVARRIRVILGLSFIPSAVQGRLGSAKGMWIVDVTAPQSTDDVWIETFPSQRKWKMDWSSADYEHRTLEIRGFASRPKPASFNLQFLPVIEDRAVDKKVMRKAIGDLLKSNLRAELDGQKKALQTPLQLRQWCHENSVHKFDRVVHGHVPHQGGSPDEDEEFMNSLLDAGFDPRSNRYLSEVAYGMQRRKCDNLKSKLNITVGRSAYLYMVVDFEGILEENEVHIGFSTAFEADENWSKTMVQGPVLVARSPAHYTSDIQKVQAVFKPQLADLTDVVVFSSKGSIPLADKLSGGDYDGDLAWVCWDPRIVDNFENAAVPQQPDLSPWMTEDKESLHAIHQRQNKAGVERHFKAAIAEMLSKCFQFNLAKSMLGVCTIYKEKLCYQRQNVCDDVAVLLSTLLSKLVDQAKQGIKFTADDFRKLRKDYHLPSNAAEPLYKKTAVPPGCEVSHIIDYLKFHVAKPTIDSELQLFHVALKLDKKDRNDGPQHWDPDLVSFYKVFNDQATGQSRSKSAGRLLARLRSNIEVVAGRWEARMTDQSMSFSESVSRTYTDWQDIKPYNEASGGRQDSKTIQRLCLGGEMSQWSLLKASTAFHMYCNPSGSNLGIKPRFVWQMACRQLCYLKALAVTSKGGLAGAVSAPAIVIPGMYAGLRPDAKFVRQRTARMEGGSHFDLSDDDGDVVDEDD